MTLDAEDEKSKWRRLISSAQLHQTPDLSIEEALAWPITADEGSAGDPALVLASDGFDYIVKGPKIMSPGPNFIYQVAADVIVGKIGRLLSAPVPETRILELTTEMQSLFAELNKFQVGSLHASRYYRHYGKKEGIQAASSKRESLAYARLAVLYGWLGAFDLQLIRTADPQEPTLSVDHGHFFANGAEWHEEQLSQLPEPKPRAEFISCGADRAGISKAVDAAKLIDDGEIAAILGEVPTPWGLPLDDLVSLGIAISSRRNTIGN